MRIVALIPVSLGLFLACALGLVGTAGQKPTIEIAASFKGHTEPVYAVAITPDQKTLITGSFDHSIKLWDIATGKELRTYSGANAHNKLILSLAVSPDGTMFASGAADNTIRLWDVPVSVPIKTVPLSDVFQHVALTPDGTKLVLGSIQGKVAIVTTADFKETSKLDAGPVATLATNTNASQLVSGNSDGTLSFVNPSAKEVVTVGGHRGGVHQVVVHPNNSSAISVGADGMARFWTINPPRAKQLSANNTPLIASALSTDGQVLLLAGADKLLRLVSVPTGKDLRPLAGAVSEATAVALNPANTLAAAGHADGKWSLWNATDGKTLGQVAAHAGKLTALAFHPQQPQLATAGADGTVKFWALPPVPAKVASHPAEIVAALGTPDGKKLVTASSDNIVRILETGKMSLEKQFPAQPSPITSLGVAGTLIVTGGGDGQIRFWNPATGKDAAVITGHVGPVTSLAATTTSIFSTSEDGAVKAWQLPPVDAKIKPMAHADQVTSLALHPDNQKIITGSPDRIVRLWNLADFSKLKDFTGPTLAITSVAVSGNGALVAAGSADKSLHLWKLADGQVLQKWTLSTPVQAVAFNPDQQTVAAGLSDGTIKVFKTTDFKDPKEIKSFALAKGAIQSLAYSPKNDLLFAACADKAVQGVAVADGTAKMSLGHVGPVGDLHLSRDGTKLAAISGKTVKLWSIPDGKEIGTINLPAEAKSVSFAPDASRLAVACIDRFVRLYQIDGTLVELFAHEGPAHVAAMIDAKKIVSGGADKNARLWSSSLVWQKNHSGPARQILLSPKGDAVFSAGDDKVIKAWAPADGKEIRVIPAHDAPVLRLAISPDASRLASAGADKQIKVWDLVKPDTKPVHQTAVTQIPESLAINHAGQFLAYGLGKEIKVIDPAMGKEAQTFAEHDGPITSLQFLADQKTLVTGSKDKTAKLLTVTVLGTLDAHPGGVSDLQWNAAGQLLTAGADKTVKLWDLAKRAVVKSFGPLSEPITTTGFSRDFQLIAAGTGKALTAWNVADGKEVVSLAHPAEVRSFSFKADKSRLVTACADKQTRLWDVALGKELQFSTFADPVSAAYLDANGTTILSVAGKTAQLDSTPIQRVMLVDNGPVHGLAIHPNGSLLYTVGADKTIKVWNLGNFLQEKTLFPPASGALRAVAVSKNSQLLAAAGDDKTIRIIGLADNKELAAVPVEAPVRDLAFSANSQLVVASLTDKKLIAFNTTFNPGQPLPPEFLKPAQTFSPVLPLTSLAMAPDNVTVYTPGAAKGVDVWKIASLNPIKSLQAQSLTHGLAFHPKAPVLVSGSHDGKVRFWDVPKAAVLKEIAAHVDKTNPNPIYTIAFSPDGNKVLTSSFDHSLKLYDFPAGNFVREFKPHHPKDFPKGHADEVFAAAFSPDGKQIASGSGGLERVIKIWNAEDGKVIRDLPNGAITDTKQPAWSHPGWIYHLRFLKDGRLVSIGDAPKDRGYVAIWNAGDGKQLFGEMTDFGTIYGAALSSDEKLLAVAAGNRGRAKVDLNQAHLLRVPGINK